MNHFVHNRAVLYYKFYYSCSHNTPITIPIKSHIISFHSQHPFSLTLSYISLAIPIANTRGHTTHRGSRNLPTTVRIADRMMCLQPSKPMRLKRLAMQGIILSLFKIIFIIAFRISFLGGRIASPRVTELYYLVGLNKSTYLFCKRLESLIRVNTIIIKKKRAEVCLIPT